MNPRFTHLLVCPVCKGPLLWDTQKSELYCRSDKKAFPVIDGIPSMIPEEARTLSDEELEEKNKRCETNRS